ncbi:MAG TPA: amino acid adenylation domain-containing protein, partial [Anaerolineae bacterium]|nr:amino acid adenylation domain-containing protein [Anaerolineae bacterium]
LAGNPTFAAFLERMHQTVLTALEHGDYPFPLLVERLQPTRDPSRSSPLFQVVFSWQKTTRLVVSQNMTSFALGEAGRRLELGELLLESLALEQRVAPFDLLLLMAEAGGELVAAVEYNTDLFDAVTIQRLLGHFQTLLESIVADPNQRISTLPLLTEAEQRQLLVEWNDTTTDYPQDQCIHELFETQVERTPEATAVVFEKEQLTYGELNRRANQLAHHLQKLGVGPETLVGICVERSPEMIIGLLGILKAGGAYVPLDPDYPRERLVFMLEDARVPILLTQSHLLERLEVKRKTQDVKRSTQYAIRDTLCLDADWETIAQESAENPTSGVTAENLAYVIYTSGSTGTPKGVAMRHRPLYNLLSWQLRNWTLPNGARTLQFAPLSFDVSFQEIFSTWCSGGTLVLISEGMRQDIARLLRSLTDEKIERLFLPFVALQHLAEATDGQAVSATTLGEVITAGEQLQITRSIASLFGTLEGCTLHNQYGPSESHVVTAFTLMGSPSDWSALPPIGRPIDNTQIHLLDKHLQLVPIGVPGELYIGGDSLARGYLNRPGLTAERFLPDPFSEEPGARLYKTGDLARYLPDGNIEFLGRADHQVKIRGFRVELGEIEAVLGGHPALREVVVLAREDGSGSKRLVAYVIPAQKPVPTVSELRDFLKEKLPEYMVPSAFVTLEALPLTPSGKVDRRALPAPDGARPELEGAFVAPRTPVEKELAGIWTQVLGVERVGIYDNFFDLGGHSLLATQVISRVRTTYQVDLPLRRLFETPTVAGLAALIAQSLAEQEDSAQVAQMLAELEQLPEDKVQEILADEISS